MKNSAETESNSGRSDSEKQDSGKSGFSLFSIDEHRLSVGLLAMVLLAGTGYGLWMVVSPFLPAVISAQVAESRNQIGDKHRNDGEWNDAISVYNEMLEDDPDNGLVILKVAASWDNQLTELWDELEKIKETNPEVEISEQSLAEESRLFEQSTKFWTQLLDNARYRTRSYIRLACLHSLRSRQLDAPQEKDKAIAVLEEMLENGCVTRQGVQKIEALIPVRDHKRFSNVVLEEKRMRARSN